MKKTLINWLGLLGVVSLLSYTAAVIFAPTAYPGYNWMAQAVSDLSANNALVLCQEKVQIKRELFSKHHPLASN